MLEMDLLWRWTPDSMWDLKSEKNNSLDADTLHPKVSSSLLSNVQVNLCACSSMQQA